MIEVHPVVGIGEVAPGDDLIAMLLVALEKAKLELRGDDVLVVTQKIVSKAEGRMVALSSVAPSEEARRLASLTGKDPRLVELVLSQSTAVVRAAPNVLITRHHLGLVMANAGIDRSNLGPGYGEHVLLLPLDPDHSADKLRGYVLARTGVAPGVLISDSFGRPWRNGVTGIAIGAAGMPSLIDRRGELDRDGRPLEVTQVAAADLLASAAALATGEGAEGVPFVLIRGMAFDHEPRAAASLVRPASEDLFL